MSDQTPTEAADEEEAGPALVGVAGDDVSAGISVSGIAGEELRADGPEAGLRPVDEQGRKLAWGKDADPENLAEQDDLGDAP